MTNATLIEKIMDMDKSQRRNLVNPKDIKFTNTEHNMELHTGDVCMDGMNNLYIYLQTSSLCEDMAEIIVVETGEFGTISSQLVPTGQKIN